MNVTAEPGVLATVRLGPQLRTLRARDLSSIGWSLNPVDPWDSVAVVEGRRAAFEEICEVCVHRVVVFPSDIPWIAEVDREFAAAEMTSFLMAWFEAIGHKVTPCTHPSDESIRRSGWQVVVWGELWDPPSAEVYRALIAIGATPYLITHADLLVARFDLGDSGPALVWPNHRRLELADVGAIYIRPECLETPVECQLMAWTEQAQARVINRPSGALLNSSKPCQLRAIHATGIRVPATRITTDPDAARAMIASTPRVIFKSISGIRSIVTDMTNGTVDALHRVANCPTMFQEYIEGTDVRCHVVGHQVFASEIRSTSIDYRYASEPPRICANEIPTDLAGVLVRMVRAMSLEVAGVDLRKTSDDEWFCLEVNPSPAFTYYTQWTQQPIAQAVATLLTT